MEKTTFCFKALQKHLISLIFIDVKSTSSTLRNTVSKALLLFILGLTFGSPQSSYAQTVTRQISASSDDAEQNKSNGSVGLTSTDLELSRDEGSNVDQLIGMRFQNITVPIGATITSATIDFTADLNESNTTDLIFRGQDADNPFGDGSGLVNFVGSADDAIAYRFNFGDGSDIISAPSGAE